jgi:hypothetical protein
MIEKQKEQTMPTINTLDATTDPDVKSKLERLGEGYEDAAQGIGPEAAFARGLGASRPTSFTRAVWQRPLSSQRRRG